MRSGRLRTEQDIHLDVFLNDVHTKTPYGLQRKLERSWYTPERTQELEFEFDQVDYFLKELQKNPQTMSDLGEILSHLKEVKGSVLRARAGDVLDEVELFEIKQFGIFTEKVVSFMREHCPDYNVLSWFDFSGLLKLLDPAGENLSTFYIYGAYSEKLVRLRKEKEKIEATLFSEEHAEDKEELLQRRREVLVFIEEEEYAIRNDLSRHIKEISKGFFICMDSLSKLDHWLAKAEISHRLNCSRPVLTKQVGWQFKGLKNPHLKKILESSGGSYQPLDLTLHAGTTLLSGANMGGKTMTLKTFFLGVSLVQMGYFPPCDQAEGNLFDRCEFIGTDEQDVLRGLSSFAAEMTSLKELMEIDSKLLKLVVLDEPARGTNPHEAVAILKVIAKHFHEDSSMLFLSSHYNDIATPDMNHLQVKGISDVDFTSVDLGHDPVSRIQSHMDYSVHPVSFKKKVPEEAVKIMELLDFDKDTLDAIKKQL